MHCMPLSLLACLLYVTVLSSFLLVNALYFMVQSGMYSICIPYGPLAGCSGSSFSWFFSAVDTTCVFISTCLNIALQQLFIQSATFVVTHSDTYSVSLVIMGHCVRHEPITSPSIRYVSTRCPSSVVLLHLGENTQQRE